MFENDEISGRDIDSMSGEEFEVLVATLFSRMGYSVEKSATGADGGIDIVANSSDPVTGGKYVIQCKRFASPISEPILRDLYGVVCAEGAIKGLLVTTATFTAPSRRFAEDKPLELIDGEQLRTLLARHMPRAKECHSNAARTLPSHFDLFCRQLDKTLSPIWSEYDGIRDGYVHVKRRQIASIQSYITHVRSRTNEAADLLGVFTAVGNEVINTVFVCVEAIEAQDVSLAASRLTDPTKRLFTIRKGLTCIIPPNGFEVAHTTMLAGLDEWLDGMRRLHRDFVRIRKDPSAFIDSEGHITLNLTLGGDEFKRAAIELKRANRRATKSCAVVTACFGNPSSPEVVVLRQWRDETLARYRLGRVLIATYYVISPSIANMFRHSSLLAAAGRKVIRLILKTTSVRHHMELGEPESPKQDRRS